MTTLRHYQSRAVSATNALLEQGRSVCLVAPTGAGKTVMMAALKPDVVIVHRRELLAQAQERVPSAACYTVQGLLASGDRPVARRIAYDEAHHYVADEWQSIAESYPSAQVVGVTATPERTDGRPLGAMFSNLVVAASYSELLDAGHLCPAKVLAPSGVVESGLAQDPVGAYLRYAPGTRAIVYVASVRDSERVARELCDVGVTARSITEATPSSERDETVAAFRTGSVQVLTNVYALTEGLDVPEVSTIVLARRCSSAGMYLQIAGRGLRPSPDKSECLILDLVGASLVHGLPTEDRAYSLTGEGIARAANASVRNCLQCGACYPSSVLACPHCGWQPAPRNRPPPRIWSLDLVDHYAGEATPSPAKRAELGRLLRYATVRGWAWDWVAREYERLFGAPPTPVEIKRVTTAEERYRYYEQLQKVGREKGYKSGWASHRYRQVVGTWPRRA